MTFDEILSALLEQDRMDYQEICNLGIRRQDARVRLDGLKKKGFVLEEGRKKWKRGKKLFYSLTEKGREECFRQALDNIKQGLEDLERITASLFSDPKRLVVWRNSAKEAIRKIAKNDRIPLQKRVELTATVREESFGSLRNALRTMHQISLKLFAPSKMLEIIEKLNEDVYLQVKENGIINTILEDEVDKHGDVPVSSM
jgi:predicted ArsR family transcriptional regulator